MAKHKKRTKSQNKLAQAAKSCSLKVKRGEYRKIQTCIKDYFRK